VQIKQLRHDLDTGREMIAVLHDERDAYQRQARNATEKVNDLEAVVAQLQDERRVQV
jgi:polyhydroxyalkanoate synthesis regulator phasin